MATDTQTTKMTKADLKDALAVAEFNLGICNATVSDLRTSVNDRDLRIAQLQEENMTRLLTVTQLEDALRSTGAQVAQINSDIQTEREAAAQVEEALATDVEDLFRHLHFAVATLSTITAYGGDDANVLRDLAVISGNETIELVQRGVKSGRYSVEGALSMAVVTAYEALAEQDAGEPDIETVQQPCDGCVDCGGNF